MPAQLERAWDVKQADRAGVGLGDMFASLAARPRARVIGLCRAARARAGRRHMFAGLAARPPCAGVGPETCSPTAAPRARTARARRHVRRPRAARPPRASGRETGRHVRRTRASGRETCSLASRSSGTDSNIRRPRSSATARGRRTCLPARCPRDQPARRPRDQPARRPRAARRRPARRPRAVAELRALEAQRPANMCSARRSAAQQSACPGGPTHVRAQTPLLESYADQQTE